MLFIISPAKTLDFSVALTTKTSLPVFLDKAGLLASAMQRHTPSSLEKLLNISHKLAETNMLRYSEWAVSKHPSDGRPAIMVYKGDVYQGLRADDLNEQELEYAQAHLRILSALYGVLLPLDLILPYRLDMASPVVVKNADNLYDYWKKPITTHLKKALERSDDNILINLASDEYTRVIDFKVLKTRVIQPVFKDFSNGQYKVISFFAKKARGLMSRFIIKNQPANPEDLKLFNEDGYHYSDLFSEANTWVFTRG